MFQLTPLTIAIAYSDGLDRTVKVSCGMHYGKKNISEFILRLTQCKSLHQSAKQMTYKDLFMIIYFCDRCSWCGFVSVFVVFLFFLVKSSGNATLGMEPSSNVS